MTGVAIDGGEDASEAATRVVPEMVRKARRVLEGEILVLDPGV